MGDGVYAAVEGTEACCLLQSGAAKLFLLDADAQAAGISKPAGDFSRIDMDGLVVLTEQYLRQLAWY
jgi:sulfur relay protein TusB/DsrH